MAHVAATIRLIESRSKRQPDRAKACFVGVPPHASNSAPSRAIDYAVSIPIGAVASVGPMPAGRSAARAPSAGSHTAKRQKAASAYLSALRVALKDITSGIPSDVVPARFSHERVTAGIPTDEIVRWAAGVERFDERGSEVHCATSANRCLYPRDAPRPAQCRVQQREPTCPMTAAMGCAKTFGATSSGVSIGRDRRFRRRDPWGRIFLTLKVPNESRKSVVQPYLCGPAQHP